MIRWRIPEPLLFCLALVALIVTLTLPALARASLPWQTSGPTTEGTAKRSHDQPPTLTTPDTATPTPTPEDIWTLTPSPTPTPEPSPAATVLYDGALGTGLPATQGLLFLSQPATGTELAATQVFADRVTTLTTSTQTSDKAGYFPKPGLVAALDRSAGFTVRFTVRVTEEEHAASDKNGDGVGDRAGFSVIALSSDLRGIELGFWRDQVWAQEDGAAEPPPNSNTLFTHAEGAPFDTSDGLVAYALHIQGDRYTLENEGVTILTGSLRDYSVFGWPYNVPSFLFFGDDTSSASGTIRFSYAAVETSPPPIPATPEPTKIAVFLPAALRSGAW